MDQTRQEIQRIKDDIRKAKQEFFGLQQTLPMLQKTQLGDSASARIQGEICIKAVNNSQLVLVESVYKLAKAISKLACHVQGLENRIEAVEANFDGAKTGNELAGQAQQNQFSDAQDTLNRSRRAENNGAQLLKYVQDFPLNREQQQQRPAAETYSPMTQQQHRALKSYVAKRLYDIEESD